MEPYTVKSDEDILVAAMDALNANLPPPGPI
jgi:hypothetical protein